MSRETGMIAAAQPDEPAALYERLHARRDEFERAVVAQFQGSFGAADAEDLVSAALERILVTTELPEPVAAMRWFQRVVTNVALDELRRRRGRAGGSERGGVLREVILLSQLAERGQEPSDALSDPIVVLEALEEATQRAEESQRTRRVLDALDPDDVRLLMIRNVEVPPTKGRSVCAEKAGLSEEAWRHRYSRAWARFVAALAAAAPTQQCAPVRELIGQLDAGALANGAARDARGRVDAHILECKACHVFARDSYRILALTPGAPAIGLGVEHLADHASGLVDRGSSAEEAIDAAGRAGRMLDHATAVVVRNGEGLAAGGVAGSGLLALLGGSAGGALKVLAVVCGVSVTAAGLCGGVIATVHLLESPKAPKVAAHEPRHEPRSSTTATPVQRAVPTAARTVVPKKRSPRPRAKHTMVPRKDSQPASIPSGSSGREFSPVASNSTSQASPVSSGGGSEFAP